MTIPEYSPDIKIGFLYDPVQKQYLAKEPTETSPAIWTPWKMKYGLVIGSFDLEQMCKDWPYLRGCVLEEIKE